VGCLENIAATNPTNNDNDVLVGLFTFRGVDKDKGQGDGVADYFETNNCHSSPNFLDSDADNLPDYEECILVAALGDCDNNKADTDGDGLPDEIEFRKAKSCQERDFDGDGDPDITDCAPRNSQRGHNLPDHHLDGIDSNCIIDDPTPPKIPEGHLCAGF